ncbi:MAG: carboxypeptidase regulatory-like domain-containing protein [Verrucomicrobiota bacterium]
MIPLLHFVRRTTCVLAVASIGMSATSSAVTFAQTYFVPLPAPDLQVAWQAIGTGATIGNSIRFATSVAIPRAGTQIYYDHWEDGYDANPAAPGGTTTVIWGDGITTNGTAPGYPTDIVPAGGVIVLNNSITLPRVATQFFYDDRDRISSTQAIAVARAGWPVNPGAVIGTSGEAYDTRKFGNSFQMPVGTGMGGNQQFEYVSIHIMASQDGTLVQVDVDANGSVDQTQTLNMGQTMFVNGGVLTGATVTASKPVQVHEVTGDIASNYESRTFAVRPTAQWSSGYFAPVTTTNATYPHVVYLYNPGTRAIEVSYEGLSTTGTVTVPAKGNASFVMPLNSSAHFFTVTGEPFYAVGANDAGTATNGGNQSFDWGYALMPDTSLTTTIIAPFAPGADDIDGTVGVPDGNGSPVWVTPTSTTTIYVNYGGDRDTGPNTAPDGSKYDVSYLVPKLGVKTISNPTTRDMSRALIFTTDSTGLAGGWGEDAATAGTGSPFLDLGYAIIPFAAPIFSKNVALSTDVNSNGVIDQGDTVLFTLFLNNDGVTELENPTFTDPLPPGVTYVAHSTVLNGVAVPDDGTGTAYPLDAAGITPPTLAPGASATIKFRVLINSGTKTVTNTATATSPSVSLPMLATVTFPVSPVIITGKVFNDANGLTDGIVNGTATNASGTLYANIVRAGVVQQVYLVDADGGFRFINQPGNSNYSIVLSTTRGTIDAAPPAAALPAGWVNTGENLGLGVANDGNPNGELAFSVASTSVANANFGIERIPTAAAATATSQANPGGSTRVTVPTLSGTDTEDTSVTTFIINTLPSNGTLYYNGIAVTAGQVIPSYSATLLRFDPNDGAFTASFTYSAVDAAGKSSTPATVSMPFTSVSVSGIVYNDANGTTDNTVNGTGSNAGGELFMNLVTGGNVAQVLPVGADGTFTFLTVPAASYTLVLSTTQGMVGSAAPAAALPTGYATTAEKLGTGTGNDGTANGSISITVASTSITNARFGFDRLPTAFNVTAASQTKPTGNNRVAVPTIGGTDPEDGTATTIVLNTTATNGALYYNNSATSAGQVITNFNPALLTVDPSGTNSATTIVSFTYSVRDAAGLLSPAATVTMPFTGTGISIFGNVFNDANGLTDSIVNGSGTNGGGLYAILSAAGVVSQSVVVDATGAFVFPSVTANTNYTVSLSTSTGSVGAATPAVSLPTGYVSTGEFIGTGAGSDGDANSSLAVAVTTTSISNANLAIERIPAATALTATMANPGGSVRVVVPQWVGTDAEDGALSDFIIQTLSSNGTLYYNGSLVTTGQAITNYIPSLLELDPNDGPVTTLFTYSSVDAAGKVSPAANVTITFTSIGISGKVFDDANGLTDSTVNGTGSNAGSNLYVNLVHGGLVAQVGTVAANGNYSFTTVAPNTTYAATLSTTPGSIGSAPPAASLPAGFVNTGEFIGTAAGNDGTVDGNLIIAVATTAVANANFGIDAIPTAVIVSAASQANPAGNNQVTVPTLSGTDAEDGAVTRFTLLSLPTNGTLFYNNLPVAVGQIITGYTASLLKFDPYDGELIASFNYASLDAAGKASAAATVTMPFSTISITGIVFSDTNGLTDGTVNGSGTNLSNTLYANLVSGGNVVQSQSVQLAGTYNFISVLGNTSYTVVISTTQGTVGAAAPAASLPPGYVNTGEFIGAGVGNDGSANGSLAVPVIATSVSNANFGVEQPPSASAVIAASQLNPAGNARVAVPQLAGTDPEDLSITSYRIDTLPTNGTLYYNGNLVSAGQTISNYVPALLTVDPADGSITVSLNYSAVDAAGMASASVSVTLPFTHIGLAGNVYQDANGLIDGIVNGTAYAGPAVFANLVSGGMVTQSVAVSGGSYSFGTVAASTNYTISISTLQGVVGSAAPSAMLPGTYANTGEFLGAGTGNDGTVNGQLVVAVGTASVTNANFGVRQNGIASGRLYIDINGNGIQDLGEAGLADVDVVVTDAFGATLTVVTDSLGHWTASVPPGSASAKVQESDPNFPSTAVHTQGNDPTAFTAIAGSSVNGGTDGYFIPGSITGSVLANLDGSGDQPLQGVVISLLDGSGAPVLNGLGQPITALSQANGSYSFTGLVPGNYRVQQSQPVGYGSVSDTDGANNNVIGDEQAILVVAGENNSGNDFYEIQLGAISGFVLANGAPLAHVTLTLLNSAGAVIDGNPNVTGIQPITVTTDANGFYSFTGVMPGNYQVAQTQPAYHQSESDKDGGNLDIVGDLTPIVVLPGQTSATNNFTETVNTCATTWAHWKFLHPSESASGNSDADGYDNLAEFAFAMPFDRGLGNAWLGSTGWIIQPSETIPGTLEGVFVRPNQAIQNVSYSLQYAAALGNPTVWQSVTLTPEMMTVTSNGDCTETVTLHGLETLTGLTGGSGFVRLRAELDEQPPSGTDHASFTEVEGWKETGLEICCRTYSNPFLRETAFTGTVSGVSGQTLDFSGSAGGEDLGALLSSGSYYLEVTSGDNEGQRFDVVSGTVDQLTIATDAHLFENAAPFNTRLGAPVANLVGDTVVLRRHWTLGELFPPNGFGATGNPTTADQIQIFANGAWSFYWLYDNGVVPPRWVRSGDNSYTNRDGMVIPPGQGLFFNNRSVATSLLAYGEVRSNDFVRPLAVGSNLLAGGYPIDQSAAANGGRNMIPGQGFFGSRDIATADTFYAWRGDSTLGATGYDSWFLNDNAPRLPHVVKWVKIGDASLTSRNAELLLLGNRSVFLRSSSGSAGYTAPAPWTP